MALAYVARYATSSAKLSRHLTRKIRERGWVEDEPEPDISTLVERYVELGYIDDEAFATSRCESLLRRGYGARRVGQALSQAGIGEDIRDSLQPQEARQRQAALIMAQKRRFGPFGGEPPDRAQREKQIAAMLRAGHGFEEARRLVDAPSEDAAENWARELDEDESYDEL